MKRSRKVVSVPISAIKVLNSRNRNRARLKELVRSIGTLGLKRPITLSKRGGAYDLACGEGRVEAFTALKQADIPAILTEASVEDCILMSLIENIARRRHRPIELVSEIGRLAKQYTAADIAAQLDLSPDHVRGITYLLKHGEESLVSAVERGIVPPTLAVEIAKAKTPKLQGVLLEAYVNERHTSHQIAKMRKLVEQRHRGAMKAQYADEQINSAALVRAYKQETSRQQLVSRKADLAQGRLTFIVNALKKLLSERMFASLLRQESLDKLPLPVLRRISLAGES
ncbi:ParB/RepB/Spo0J family partition protein [Bradyrhizobium yuanmingense]|nr:plasmid partitioning protein RepB C-terminal domain-containing protein [Bradyrhizobium yuanmingense]